MTPDQWDRSQRLFKEALEQTPEVRREFLRDACGDDDEVRQEVESLLHHHELTSAVAQVVSPAGAGDSATQSRATVLREGQGQRDTSREAVQRLVGERYPIERLAGTGGMGTVFVATDSVLERRVAIKVLNVSLAGERGAGDADQEHRNRILAEARAMAGLRHPNLCRVHEVCVDVGMPYLIMDWIDGVDLRSSWLNTDLSGRLSLFVKVVEAVAAAHAARLVHADLKPINVLVDRMGEPIIVDFGLARSVLDLPSRRHLSGGTPGYAAPEQFGGQQPIGPAADVYALGAMMYEMLTDRLPYASFADMIKAAAEEDPPLPETFAPDVPWPLQRICLVALERDPQRRYPDAHAMALDVQRYLRGESVAAQPSMLTERFVERIEQQIWHVDSWLRQGLVTETEANRLNRALGGLLRPESHWILDSRRVTWSQVTLYLGGWLALVALTVGLVCTAETFGFGSDALANWPWLRPVAAWAVALSFFGAGFLIQQRGHQRVSLGYQVTACLAVPIGIWLLFRETEWLVPLTEAGEVAVEHEWLRVFSVGLLEPQPEHGLFNRQMLVVTLGWLLAATLLRRLAASSAFTLFGVLASGLAAVAAYASLNLLSDNYYSKAGLGLWLTVFGAMALWPGLRLNNVEEEHARQYGLMRTKTRDSWTVLTGAALMIAVGLTVTAWYAADLYTFGLMGEYDDESARAQMRAVAFIINGGILQAVSHLLGRRRTVVRARLADAIRWISPSHFLGGLWVLETEAGGGWLFWLIVLALASVALCYISVWRQWRPFLVTGLVWMALVYGRSFYEALDKLQYDPWALNRVRLALAAALLILGVATMILAWKLPDWIASLKLKRGRPLEARLIAIPIAIAAVVVALPLAYSLGRTVQPEDRLLGRWVSTENENAVRLTFLAGGQVNMAEAEETRSGTYVVDFSMEPAHLDLLFPESPGIQTLVEFHKGGLRLADTEAGEKRPEGISPDSSTILERAR